MARCGRHWHGHPVPDQKVATRYSNDMTNERSEQDFIIALSRHYYIHEKTHRALARWVSVSMTARDQRAYFRTIRNPIQCS